MRKWMRERLQRRKKTSPEPEGAVPPPLQPAYFEAGQSAPEPAREESSPAEVSAAKSDSTPQPAPEAQSEAPTAVTPRASSRTKAASSSRRRRGGRGRSRGREQAVAQAFTPAVAKGIIPESSGEEVAEPLESEAADSDVASDGKQDVKDVKPEIATARTPAPVPTATQRPPRGVVVLAIGLPGSGKSSWFKRHSVIPLSSDMVRSLLFDDVREQRFQDLVFSNLRSMLKARLIAKRPMNYVDATNLTPQERQHWIKLAKDYGYEVHAVFFDVPLEVCLERHQRRDRVVPEDVMRRMAGKFKPPAFEEGFAKITVVRVKKKEEGAVET
jgi:predicted kinase